jgi:NAD-dependent deacetylase
MTIEADTIAEVAQWLASSQSAVVLTGAGISTESGIPDFRSPGGIWSKYVPVYFDDFLESETARYRYWKQRTGLHREFGDAQPNSGHRALAAWEERGWLRGVITQNIDGLHQLAGSRRVLELHGTARQALCLDCQARFDIEPFVAQFLADDRVPTCPNCEGRVKHATVSFGQILPADVLEEADRWSQEADLILVIGSSLLVTPAADLPRVAKQSGARLVIINREETPLDSMADAVLRDSIGEVLTQLEEKLTA